MALWGPLGSAQLLRPYRDLEPGGAGLTSNRAPDPLTGRRPSLLHPPTLSLPPHPPPATPGSCPLSSPLSTVALASRPTHRPWGPRAARRLPSRARPSAGASPVPDLGLAGRPPALQPPSPFVSGSV